MSPLFVKGRPVLKVLYESGLEPKCNISLLRSHLRSRRTVFTENKNIPGSARASFTGQAPPPPFFSLLNKRRPPTAVGYSTTAVGSPLLVALQVPPNCVPGYSAGFWTAGV